MTLSIQTALTSARINALVPEFVPTEGEMTPTNLIAKMIEKHGLLGAIRNTFTVVGRNDRATLVLCTYLFLEAQETDDTALYALLNAVGLALYGQTPRRSAQAFAEMSTRQKIEVIMGVASCDMNEPVERFFNQVAYAASVARDKAIRNRLLTIHAHYISSDTLEHLFNSFRTASSS